MIREDATGEGWSWLCRRWFRWLAEENGFLRDLTGGSRWMSSRLWNRTKSSPRRRIRRRRRMFCWLRIGSSLTVCGSFGCKEGFFQLCFESESQSVGLEGESNGLNGFRRRLMKALWIVWKVVKKWSLLSILWRMLVLCWLLVGLYSWLEGWLLEGF